MKPLEKVGMFLKPDNVLVVDHYDCPACSAKRQHTDEEWTFHPMAGCGVDKIWRACTTYERKEE